jgi:hypothetical protein
MKNLVTGWLFGLATGVVMSAVAAQVVGSDGYLNGWTVTVNGDEVCSDPYVVKSWREIECDN